MPPGDDRRTVPSTSTDVRRFECREVRARHVDTASPIVRRPAAFLTISEHVSRPRNISRRQISNTAVAYIKCTDEQMRMIDSHASVIGDRVHIAVGCVVAKLDADRHACFSLAPGRECVRLLSKFSSRRCGAPGSVVWSRTNSGRHEIVHVGAAGENRE